MNFDTNNKFVKDSKVQPEAKDMNILHSNQTEHNKSAQLYDEENGLRTADGVIVQQKENRSCLSKIKSFFGLESSYNDVCIELFKLKVEESDSTNLSNYFMQQSRDEFNDLLGQLGKLIVSAEKRQQFEEFMEQHKQDHGLIGQFASHSDVLQFLHQSEAKEFITHSMIEKLIDFRKLAIDIFCLADDQNDRTLYKKFNELDLFWKILQDNDGSYQIQKFESDQHKQEYDEWLMKQQDELEVARFHDIQKILWTCKLDYGVDIQQLQTTLYRTKVNCARLCCLCKFARKKLITSRLKPKSPRQKHYGFSKIAAYMFTQVIHAFDIYTDLILAYKFYTLSREDIIPGQQDFAYQYNIGFTIVFIAIFGPYIIQYSTMMNVLHVKGYFKDEQFKNLYWLKRLYLRNAFTFIGLFVMPIIDILLKIQAFILVILHMMPCIKIGKDRVPIQEWVQEKMEVYYEKLFDLNSVELENFEKQKKYIQVIFEDIIMVLLQAAVRLQILNVPKMIDSEDTDSYQATINSLVTTFISVVSTLFQLYMESKGYKEYACEYIMLSMKAKQDWIPYGQYIRRRKISFDVDYSLIDLKIPYVTKTLGVYQNQEFQFSQSNLNQLAATLDVILTKQLDSSDKKQIDDSKVKDQSQLQKKSTNRDEKEMLLQSFIPKLKFGFSLMTVSVHAFLGFINKVHSRDKTYVAKYLDLNDIDWDKLIANSKAQNKTFDQDGKIDSGKPILQVCIENEDTEQKTWQLKPLMERILQLEKCDPNILDEYGEYTMLMYSFLEKKHQAFELIVKLSKDKEKFDINKFSPKINNTIFGQLFYHGSLISIDNQQYSAIYDPLNKLALLHQYYGTKINIHINQIGKQDKNRHTLITPIYLFLEKLRSQDKFSDIKKRPEFYNLFGTSDFKLEKKQEIQQVLYYTLVYKSPASDELIEDAYNRLGGLDDAMRAQDEEGNNLMHVVGCRFSEQKWQKLIKDSQLDTLIEIAKQLLKQKNKQQKTPIQTMLEDKSRDAIKVKGLIKLFDSKIVDLEKKDTFKDIEDDVIVGFFEKAVKHYENEKTRKEAFINRENFFNAFENKFENYINLQNRFKLANQEEIFNEYFKSDQIEKEYQDYIADPKNEKIIGKFGETNLDELMSKGVFDNQVAIQETNSGGLENDQKLSCRIDTLITSRIDSKPKQERHFVLELLLIFTIELASVCDFVSDCYVVYQLSQTTHTGWFTFSFFTMLAPYLTVYSSVMTFKIVDLRSKLDMNEFKCYGYITTLVLILPTILVVIIILDTLSMFVNITVYIFLCIGLITPYSRQFYETYEFVMNSVYSWLLDMSIMDVQGFKSQRTILQLHLESIPQIFFQIYLLYKFDSITFLNEQTKEDGSQDLTGKVETEALISSIVFAFVHVLLEAINLRLESMTSKTAFKDYMVACYSARLGWLPQEKDFYEIPQSHQLAIRDDHDSDDADNKVLVTDQSTENELDALAKYDKFNVFNKFKGQKKYKEINQPIDIDHKNEKILCCGFTVTFEFSNNSINYLYKIISNMKTIDDKLKKAQKVLKLGQCIKNVKLFNVVQLLRLAHGKLTIKFDEEVLSHMMQQDANFKQSIKEPDEIQEQRYRYEEHLIVDIIKYDNYEFFKQMIKHDAKIDVESLNEIKIDNKEPIPAGSSLFKIAYSLRRKEILALIMAKIDSNKQKILDSMKADQIFYNELRKGITQNPPIRLVQPLILLDPSMPIPYDMISSFNYNASKQVDSYPKFAEERWHVLNGAYVPYLNYKQNTVFVPLILKMVEWIDLYPKTIKISQSSSSSPSDSKIRTLELDSQFLCQFTAMRRVLNLNNNFDKKKLSNSHIQIDNLLEMSQCGLDDMLNVYKLYYNRLECLSLQQLKKCDKIIECFGFDKNWSEYYHNSRNIKSGLEVSEYIFKFEVVKPEFDYTLPAHSVAVKKLIIQNASGDKVSDCKIEFNFDMPHYTGLIDNIKPPKSNGQNNSANIGDQDETLVEVCFQEDEETDIGFEFSRFKNVLLNSMKGGHKIIIKVTDNDGKPLTCKFLLELYKDMDSEEPLEVDQIHLNSYQQ